MAAKYVKITRQEFEDWLFELYPVFERVEETAGAYLVPLSACVAIQVSTTMSSKDRNTSKGEGRCRMKFVNRHGRRSLQHADHDRRNANRTQGWRDTWRDNLQTMIALYKRHREKYTELALRPQPEYAKEWVERIEGIGEWEQFNILVDLRKKVQDGAWLTPAQEAAVWKFVRPAPRRKSVQRPKTKALSKEQRRLLVGVERLEVVAQEADDDWLLKFCDSLIKRLKLARDLTTRQRETLDKKLKTFNVKIPAAA
jgi:hypothetical protein